MRALISFLALFFPKVTIAQPLVQTRSVLLKDQVLRVNLTAQSLPSRTACATRKKMDKLLVLRKGKRRKSFYLTLDGEVAAAQLGVQNGYL